MIIGIDMGGTHIDGVIIDNGEIIKTIKNPTDRDDLFVTILNTLKDLLKNVDKSKILRINLSTTISTNAVIENKISKVGMLVNSGPGRNFDFSTIGQKVEFVDGYIDHRGKIVKKLNTYQINAIKDEYINSDVESIAVISKFSTRNPNFENDIKDIFTNDFKYITLGHSFSGKLNFPRRVSTAYLNAAVSKTFLYFATNIKKSLKLEGIDVPVFVLKADGGTMDLKTAVKKSVETILSGPAASFMGLNAIYNEKDDGILLDIGGTTTDIFFLANGVPLFEPLGIKIVKHKTLIRAIYSVSIGIGGDSYVRVENGQLKIGPQRKGKPIAFGGNYLAVSDAMVALDKLKVGNKELAVIALKQLGDKLGLSIEELSKLILDKTCTIIVEKVSELLEDINLRPVYTIEELLTTKKIIPKFVNIIGGPSAVLAPMLEDKFKIKVKYPKRFSIANAIGAALAKPTIEVTLHADTDRKILSIPQADIYENIDSSYNLEKAKNRVLEVINKEAVKLGANPDTIEAEITQADSYNMVKGYLQTSRNIRVTGQIKPGLIYALKGED